ncbi:MAG: hypothetical protein R3C59_16425 [Planctomycetaceae bacterium]
MANPSDDQPDFSFLGDDAVPNDADAPDFSNAEDSSGVPDFSGFGVDAASPPADIPATAPRKPRVPADVSEQTESPAIAPAERKRATRLTTGRKRPTADESAAVAASSQPVAEDSDDSRSRREKAPSRKRTTVADAVDTDASIANSSGGGVSRTVFSAVSAYAGLLTLLLLFLVATGRVSPSGVHPLESLPDVKPLKSTEFQRVPDDVPLPDGHALNLGESRRFGDIVLTPVKVTREPVAMIDPTGKPASGFSNQPVLKLWFTMENVSSEMAFPPWDVNLMCHRGEVDGKPVANSWLMVQETDKDTETQILNFFHSPDSSFEIVDYHNRELVNPGNSLTSFIAAGEDLNHIPADKVDGYRWRLQFRKGVSADSGNGVTTLVDIHFQPEDIQS